MFTQPFNFTTNSSFTPSPHSITSKPKRSVRFRSNATTRSVLIGLDVFNCIFHSLCCYLLAVIFKRSKRKKTQDLYVLNLASSELFASLFLLVRDTINFMRLYPENKRLGEVDRAFWIMNMFFVTAIQYIYILAMIYITADRFFKVLFPFR